MGITGNFDVRKISPRVIDGWSDVRFSDEETTSADFLEAVRQAILERASAVLITSYNWDLASTYESFYYVHKLSEYPITHNVLSYEIFDLIEKSIYSISKYFICGIGDSSSELIGYNYRDDLGDFPFSLTENNFGRKDDLAFFRRPSEMPTWIEMKSSGYAYRLMNAINAMTSMKIIYVRRSRILRISNRNLSLSGSWDEFVGYINKYNYNYMINYYLSNTDPFFYRYYYTSNYIGYDFYSSSNDDHYSYYRYAYPYKQDHNPDGFLEVFINEHPGCGIGANCNLRSVFATYETDSDNLDHSGKKCSYVENLNLISNVNLKPIFCHYDKMIYSPDPLIEFSSFSPSVLPPEDAVNVPAYKYGQRFRFYQYYDFGIPGGFRFRKDT